MATRHIAYCTGIQQRNIFHPHIIHPACSTGECWLTLASYDCTLAAPHMSGREGQIDGYCDPAAISESSIGIPI